MTNYHATAGLVGVTERGDAGTDFAWTERIRDPRWAGAVLITKRMSAKFNDAVLACPKPAVVHCTCTGNGGTWVEPNAPDYKTQLGFLADLLDRGLPAARAVLRVDPIIPTDEFLENSAKVLDYVLEQHIPIVRVRFSVLDQYPHVIKRLEAAGRPKFYPDENGRYSFNPTPAMKKAVADMLSRYPFVFESCAEDWAACMRPGKFIARGCVSETDLAAMGLPVPEGLYHNPQNRSGCHCLSCKGELLDRRARCPNDCIYCYWKG